MSFTCQSNKSLKGNLAYHENQRGQKKEKRKKKKRWQARTIWLSSAQGSRVWIIESTRAGLTCSVCLLVRVPKSAKAHTCVAYPRHLVGGVHKKKVITHSLANPNRPSIPSNRAILINPRRAAQAVAGG